MSEPLFAAEPALVPQPGELRLSGGVTPAETDPVASVLVESAVPHLAREFDYAVPAELDAHCRPGVRARVRFAGKLTTGYVIARKPDTDFLGELSPVQRVVSPVPVLGPETLQLCRAVADRYAGTLPDVVRLAIPARHAAAEKRMLSHDLESEATTARDFAATAPLPDTRPEPVLPAFDEFTRALQDWLGPAEGGLPGPRAVMTVLPAGQPGSGWAGYASAAAAAVLRHGRSVLVLVPDHRDLLEAERVFSALDGAGTSVAAEQGPQARCTAFLSGLYGTARLIVGTRAAAFQPMKDLGMIIVFDDAHDSYQEQRAPYPHAREVALTRTALSGCALLMLSYSRSPEAQRLVESGWAGDVRAPRDLLRQAAPLAAPVDRPGQVGRIPEDVFRAIRAALGREKPRAGQEPPSPGPVLISVPRAGYIPVLSCARCRTRILCPDCGEPVSQRSPHAPMKCPAGHELRRFSCPECGSRRVRSAVIGVDRTHEELGRAFPGTRVLRSWGDHILHRIDPGPGIVVATTGAEPLVDGGYRAAVVLDADSALARPGLRAVEETVSAWFRIGGLVAGAAEGGRLLLVGQNPLIARVMTRWDPEGFAGAELAERAELLLPPAGRQAVLTGEKRDLDDVLARLDPPAEVLVRGPVGEPPSLTLRFPHRAAPGITRRLAEITAERSARRAGEPVYVRVDARDG
ncbi:hypothetical protein [Sediminivirga luteola]|uniref:Probable replication restart protein PriA n=1 Tax=Sediminivirga luteola TaxID=1774748 RepID=A0A8J2XLF9_9MICO|nr:hypothetical protein [Sediminivirga luteola]MCI2264148.1 primosomal protein N' [Sediminivirga luteola]GGA17791.1 putative primosomal protein N' [Sediminivirga luteola]